jgi:hypothetical protein
MGGYRMPLDLLVEIHFSPNRFSKIAKDLFSFFGQNFSYELSMHAK